LIHFYKRDKGILPALFHHGDGGSHGENQIQTNFREQSEEPG